MSNQGPLSESNVSTLNSLVQAKQLAQDIFDFVKDKPFEDGNKSKILSNFYQDISHALKTPDILQEVLLNILQLQAGTTYPTDGILKKDAFKILQEALHKIKANFFCLEYMIDCLAPSSEIHQKLLLTILLDLNYAIQTYDQLLSVGYFIKEEPKPHLDTIDTCQKLFGKYYPRFKYFSFFLFTHTSLFTEEFIELYQQETLHLRFYEIYILISWLKSQHTISSSTGPNEKQISAIKKVLQIERIFALMSSPGTAKIKEIYPLEKEKLEKYKLTIETLRIRQSPLTELLISFFLKANQLIERLPIVVSMCCYFNVKEDEAKIEENCISLMTALAKVQVLNKHNIQDLLRDSHFYTQLIKIIDAFLSIEATDKRTLLDEHLHLIATICLNLKYLFNDNTNPVCNIVTQIVDNVLTHTLYAKRYLGTEVRHIFAEDSFWDSSFPQFLTFELSDIEKIAPVTAPLTTALSATAISKDDGTSQTSTTSTISAFDEIVDALLEEVGTLEPNYYYDEGKINQCLKALGSLRKNPNFIEFALNKLFNMILNGSLKITSIELYYLSIKRANQIHFFLYHLGAPLKVENMLHHALLKMLIHELSNSIYLFGVFYLQGCFKQDEIRVLYPRNARYKSLLEKSFITQRLFSTYLFSGYVPLSKEVFGYLKEKRNNITLSTFCADVSYLRTERGIIYRDNPRLTLAHAINTNGHLAQILKRKETLPQDLPNNKMLDNLPELKNVTNLDPKIDVFYSEVALTRLAFEENIIKATVQCLCAHEPTSSLSCLSLLAELERINAKIQKLLQSTPDQKEKLLESNALYPDVKKTFHLAAEVSKITTSSLLYSFIETLTKLCQSWDSLLDSHSAIWIALGYEITQLVKLSQACSKFLKDQNPSLTNTSAPISALASDLLKLSMHQKISVSDLAKATGEIIIKAKSCVPAPDSMNDMQEFIKGYQHILTNNVASNRLLSTIYRCLTEMVNLSIFSSLAKKGTYTEHQRALTVLIERINITYFTLYLLATPSAPDNLLHQQLFFMLISDIISAFKLHINLYKDVNNIEQPLIYTELLKYDHVFERALTEYLPVAEYLITRNLYPHVKQSVENHLREFYFDGLTLSCDYIQILKKNAANEALLQRHCQLFERIYALFITPSSALNHISKALKDEEKLISSLKTSYDATISEPLKKKPSKKQKKKKNRKQDASKISTVKVEPQTISEPKGAGVEVAPSVSVPTQRNAIPDLNEISLETPIKAAQLLHQPPQLSQVEEAAEPTTPSAKESSHEPMKIDKSLPQVKTKENVSSPKEVKTVNAAPMAKIQTTFLEGIEERSKDKKVKNKPKISVNKQQSTTQLKAAKASAKATDGKKLSVSMKPSSVTTAKPSVTTAEPSATAKPSVSTAKPSVSTAKPSVTTAKPAVTTAKPAVPTAQPSVPTAKPAVPTAKPTVPTAKPAVPTAKPAVPTAKPAVPTAKPAVPTAKPAVPTAKPAVPTAKPSVSKLKASAQTLKQSSYHPQPPCPSRWDAMHPLTTKMQASPSEKPLDIDIVDTLENLTLEDMHIPAPLAHHKIEVPALVKAVMQKLNQVKVQVFIFGGAIRNSLLNIPIVDYDLVVNCKRDDLYSILGEGQANPYKSDLFELKRDGIKIDIVSTEKPFPVFLEQIDISINALLCTFEGEILDPLDVIADFDLPYLKTMPKKEESPQDFAQMMLRLVRFKHTLGKDLLPETVDLMKRHALHLRDLPLGLYLKNIERLFLNGLAKQNLAFLQQSGLYPFLFPLSQRQNILLHPRVSLFLQQFWDNLDALSEIQRRECYSIHHVMAALLLPLVFNMESIEQILNDFCKNNEVYDPDKIRFKLATSSLLKDYFDRTHAVVPASSLQYGFAPPPVMVFYYPYCVQPCGYSLSPAAAASSVRPLAPGEETLACDLSNQPTRNSFSSAP